MNPMLLRRGLSVSALTFAGLLSLTSLAQAMKTEPENADILALQAKLK